MSDCTRRYHASVADDPLLWRMGTVPAGIQEDGAGGRLELGNCIRCDSTLARVLCRYHYCSEPAATGRSRCTIHLEALRLYQRRRRRERRGMGICYCCDRLAWRSHLCARHYLAHLADCARSHQRRRAA